jgi:hypothetical protein
VFNCSGYTDNPGIVQPEPEALGDLRHERGSRRAGSSEFVPQAVVEPLHLGPCCRPGRPPCDSSDPPGVPPPHRSPPPLSSPREAGLALALTAEQQARLDALPAATRDLVLTWLLTGDRILVAEAKKKLVPPRPRPVAPRTLPEVLGRIREDPSYPSLAADWLASALQDRKSYGGFKARCEEAWRGELNPTRIISAYEHAISPKARNREAIFMVVVRQKE